MFFKPISCNSSFRTTFQVIIFNIWCLEKQVVHKFVSTVSNEMDKAQHSTKLTRPKSSTQLTRPKSTSNVGFPQKQSKSVRIHSAPTSAYPKRKQQAWSPPNKNFPTDSFNRTTSTSPRCGENDNEHRTISTQVGVTNKLVPSTSCFRDAEGRQEVLGTSLVLQTHSHTHALL